MIEHEADENYILVYPKNKQYQVMVDEEKNTIDIIFGQRPEKREDLVVLRLTVLEKALRIEKSQEEKWEIEEIEVDW